MLLFWDSVKSFFLLFVFIFVSQFNTDSLNVSHMSI